LLACGDRPERRSAPLAEGAFELRLLAQRLVPAAARRALLRQRADAAARDPRKADRRTEVEERLRARAVELLAGSLLNPADVRVDRQHVVSEGEVINSGRGVRPDAGQPREVVRPPVLRNMLRSPMEVDRAPVVA